MATLSTEGVTLKEDLFDASVEGTKVKDILKGMNDAIREYNKSSHDIKQTSRDISRSYLNMLTNIEKIKNAADKSLVAQQAIKSIDVQIAVVNSEIADLKKRGLILSAEEVKYKKEELKLERALNEAIRNSLILKLNLGGISSGETDAINKQIDQLMVKNLMLDAEETFLTKREDAGKRLLGGLNRQIHTLNIVKDLHEKIVDTSAEQTKSDENRNVLLKSFLGILGTMSPILGKVGTDFVTIGKSIYKAYTDGGLLAAAMAALTEYLKIGVERFKELQETAEKFRTDTGLTLSQTSAISQYVKQLNAEYQSMGVSLEAAYISAKELMSELGNSKVLDNNKSLIQTSSLLAANYGVAASDAAGFQLNMMRVGENSAASAENMSAVAIKMSEAAGVSLPQVMKNVSSASGTTLAMVRGSNVELVKAAVHAKRFGLELETVAGAARKSLNFYESITDEMEASVLVGQQLSFQSARERAFAGDMVGFQNEILKTVGSIDKFGERSIFEQEAVAQAAGIELKELKKMLQVEEQLKKLSSTDRAEYDRLLKSNAKITEEDGKQLLKKQQIQSQLTRINNSFTAIKNKIGDSLQPALEKVADLIEWIAGLMGGASKSVEDTGEKSTSVWKALGIVILATAVGIGLLVASLKLFSLLSGGLGTIFKALAKAIGGAIAGTLHSIGNGLTHLADGMKSLGSTEALKGGVTLVLLAAAALGVAYALKLAAEGIVSLLNAGLKFGEIMGLAVVSIGGLIAVLITLSKTLPLIGDALTSLGKTAGNPAALKGLAIFAAVMATVSLTALALGYSAKLIGDGFKSAGEGAKLFADSLVKLAEIGFIKLSAGLYGISGAILALSASLITMSASGTPKFLNDLVSMSASLLPVASALEQIANALERISKIKSFPEFKAPQIASTELAANAEGIAGAAGKPVGANEKSNNNIIDKVDKLTESVDQLVQFMKVGGVIANTYLDGRLVSMQLARANVGRG